MVVTASIDRHDLGARRMAALDALGYAEHSAAREALIAWADEAIQAQQTGDVAQALTWLGLGADFAIDATETLDLVVRARALPATDTEASMIAAAGARLAARLPLDKVKAIPGMGDGLLTWHVTIERAHALSALANKSGEAVDEPVTSLAVQAAWRATHRSPAVLAERTVASDAGEVETIGSGIDLDRSLHVDLWLWASVDALEAGDRARHELLLRRARAQALLGVPGSEAWWVATTTFLSLWLDGELEAARSKMEEAFALGTSIGHPGALAVYITQRWQVDELAGAHDVYVRTSREQAAQFGHPLAIVAAGLSEVRGGTIARAEEWARRIERIIVTDHDQETTWLNVLVLSADLATELIRAGSPAGLELATVVRPQIEQWTDRVAVDGRGVCSAGPVARASAELALALGDVASARQDMKVAEHVLDAIGRPPVSVAEHLLARIRLAIAQDEPAAEDLAILLSMTSSPAMAFLHRQGQALARAAARSGTSGLISEYEAQVLDLLVEGQTNREIADRLAYSLSKVSKDVMVIIRKLGVTNRTEAAAAWTAAARR